MVDLDVLEKHGVTVDRLKEIFTATKGTDVDIAKGIKTRIRNRVQAGISYNLANYRHWYACDVAWDVPFQQSTYSLVRGMMGRKMKDKDIIDALEGADLSDMIVLYDKSGRVLSGRVNPGDVAEVKVNAPTFFQIFIPLAKAYTTIRAAAIVNSYRQVPLFQYEAAKSTAQNRLKSDIITDRVELMSTQYGYFDVIKEAVVQMLHYSQAILFPTEEWDSRPQRMNVPSEADPTKTEEKEVMVKEGMRYNIPHPSRVFLDTAFRPSTINSDTGVAYAGYWCIIRYGELKADPRYWNTDHVSTSSQDWISNSPAFFNTVYSSCALRFGSRTDTDRGDRETKTAWYTMADPDRALTLVQYFEKINPKKEGIGDYDYDVWFRFVVAGQDTIAYAAPLPYCPMAYFGYDALETRAQNSSMTLEVLPFQDHISNLFSQYLLTVKNNLTNITFFDTNQVDKKVIDDIKNLGQKSYANRNFMPMDMRVNRMGAQNNIQEAFQSFTFPHQATEELISGVEQLLGILDRILVLSPQELAQTASHELTAEEVRNMNQGKSTRYEYTAGAVDRGVYALKVMLYQGLMAYGESDLYARLSAPVDTAELTKLGFTVEHDDKHTVLVSGKKTALLIESWASNRDGDLRINSPQVASSMVQLLQAITANPALLQEIGAPQIISLINEIASIGGLPRDFRFVSTGNNAQAQAQEMQKNVQGLATQIEHSAVAEVAANLKPIFQSQAQKFAAIEKAIQQLTAVVSGQPAPNAPPPNASIPNPPQPNPTPAGPQLAVPPGGNGVPQGV